MSDIKDGGPAFVVYDTDGSTHKGMSLRDWYAGQAMAGDFAAQNDFTGAIATDSSAEMLANRARLYLNMADAMIAAREAKP